LKNYFFTRHLLTEKETVYENINVFQPGETLEINLKSLVKKFLHIEKLTDLICEDKLKDNSKKNDNDILIEADNIMKKNAEFLNPEIDFFSVVSGGIDSTLVSKYLNDFSDKKPNYICLQFPKKDNVASGVKSFEKYLKNTIKEVNVDVDLFQNYLNESYKSICMPLPTHSFISQAILAREVNKEGAKILFTGDGGDELFGGYEFYKTINFNNSYKYNPSVYSGVYNQGVKFKNYNFDELKEINSSQWNNIFDNYHNFNLLEANVHSILLLDTKVQLESVGIRASDTMSMMSSVESRGFFLTKMILDFAINLPANKKILVKSNNIETRPLMKNLFVKQFDKSLLKPKQGFSGFPNESMKKIINNFNTTREFLDIEEFEKLDIENNLALEWKFLNVEYFLEIFLNNAK
jgi:asparagine synthase (glutamine-hydrolysing)